MLTECGLNTEMSGHNETNISKWFGHREGMNEDQIIKWIHEEKVNGLKGRVTLRKSWLDVIDENMKKSNEKFKMQRMKQCIWIW